MRGLLGLLLLAMGLTAVARAETFPFPEHGFEMTCLDSWEQISTTFSEEEMDGWDYGSRRINDSIQARSETRILRLLNPDLPHGTPPEILLKIRPANGKSAAENLRDGRQRLRENLNVLSIFGPKEVQAGEFDGALLDVSIELKRHGQSLMARILLWRVQLESKELSVIATHTADVDTRALPEIEDCVQSLRRIGQP